MKKISLEQLLAESRMDSYSEQYRYICGQIESGKIMPVKSSPLNGKKPALHISYWRTEEKADDGEEIKELQFRTVPAIRTDFYLKHMEVYREERKWVRLLNRFLLQRSQAENEDLPYVSLNERSFQIWGREKFLQREQGRKILAHCGVGLEELHVYGTTEPLAYYSCTRKAPTAILILENKDTFYTMRRWLMGEGGAGGMPSAGTGSGEASKVRKFKEELPGKMFGTEIGTVIYGAGKGILRSFEDFQFCMEPHINHPDNEILYFGDLDYEGIGIYERLASLFSGEREHMPERAAKAGSNGGVSCADAGENNVSGTGAWHEIRPFVQAYEKMIKKARIYGIDFLPKMSENQNHNLSGYFFRYFSDQTKESMNCILKEGRYIPQEILTIADF